ncbi:hypothetical protein [Streptomyces inhibens]|uniref:hypothetical protein n=1 Tax=Streptomyces inhibens TaxID=2293571 RepID=UPI001EE75C96|nr:hypothetical protein [Streptomyces inhibens]UKY47837.1 hypothetical protein KI385_02650 [Streptomyces inhibens]
MPPAPPTAVGTTPHTTPVRTTLGGQAITVVLPADFTAFCQLHYDVYQHYAHQLVANHDAAVDAVQHALGDLAASWAQALAGHRTAAIAWAALTRRIHQAARTPAGTAASALYGLVPAPEADAVLLHHVVGLSITACADTLGAEEATVTSLLHNFDRRLTADGAEALRACWAAASRGTSHPL